MPAPESLFAFFGIAVLLALSPGPDNIFVLMQSAQHGWRAGIAIVLGLCCGVAVLTAAIALGLAAVVAASAGAFTLIKLCGTAYLLWLAWGAWHAPVARIGHAGQASKARPRPRFIAMWGRGLIMNLTNPKVLIFFLAFLPQFADPQASLAVPWQIVIYGMVFDLAALLVFGAIACFSGAFGQLLQKSALAQKALNRLASMVFAGLAIRLATLHK